MHSNTHCEVSATLPQSPEPLQGDSCFLMVGRIGPAPFQNGRYPCRVVYGELRFCTPDTCLSQLLTNCI